jgi:putative transposase
MPILMAVQFVSDLTSDSRVGPRINENRLQLSEQAADQRPLTRLTMGRLGVSDLARTDSKAEVVNLKELLATDQDYLRKMVETIVQATLEAEMTEAVSAEKSERTPARLSYRSGYYSRSLITRVGTLELRVPQDRQGRFSTELFERYQRAEKTLVAALVEMYVQGVSTRKVKAVTEDLCGHNFSASASFRRPTLIRARLAAARRQRLWKI